MILEKFNSVFVHIPKTGGTSVEYFFLREMGLNPPEPLNAGTFYKGLKHLGLGRKEDFPLQHLRAWELKKRLLNYSQKYSFSLVRNPTDRFISELAWKNLPITKKDLFEYLKGDSYRTQSQHSYLHSEDGTLLVNEVFKLENIGLLEETLSDRFNIKVTLPHEQASSRPRIEKSLYDFIDRKMRCYRKLDFESFDY